MAGPVHVLSMQGKNLDKVDAHMQKEIKVEGREAPFWGFSARPSRYSEKTPERLVPVPHLSPMMTASISVFCTRHPQGRSCQSQKAPHHRPFCNACAVGAASVIQAEGIQIVIGKRVHISLWYRGLEHIRKYSPDCLHNMQTMVQIMRQGGCKACHRLSGCILRHRLRQGSGI